MWALCGRAGFFREAVKQQWRQKPLRVGRRPTSTGSAGAASSDGSNLRRSKIEFDLRGVLSRSPKFLQEALSHIRKLDRGRRFLSAKTAGENIFLGGEGVEHVLFDGVFGDEVNNLHRRWLSVTMGAGDALFEHGGIPREVKVDDKRWRLAG